MSTASSQPIGRPEEHPSLRASATMNLRISRIVHPASPHTGTSVIPIMIFDLPPHGHRCEEAATDYARYCRSRLLRYKCIHAALLYSHPRYEKYFGLENIAKASRLPCSRNKSRLHYRVLHFPPTSHHTLPTCPQIPATSMS